MANLPTYSVAFTGPALTFRVVVQPARDTSLFDLPSHVEYEGPDLAAAVALARVAKARGWCYPSIELIGWDR